MLAAAPVITISGELCSGTCMFNPPAGYVLADLEWGKRFITGSLDGQLACVEGAADWLDAVRLPRDLVTALAIHMTPLVCVPRAGEPLIHSRCVLTASEPTDAAADVVRQVLVDTGLVAVVLGGPLADSARMADLRLQAAADTPGVPLRFLPRADPVTYLRQTLSTTE